MAAGKDKSSFVDERIDRFGIPVSQKDLLVQIVFNMESFIMAMGAARDWRSEFNIKQEAGFQIFQIVHGTLFPIKAFLIKSK